MDCHESYDFMMKYMDSTLTESEAAQLGAHLEGCPACKSDFHMYDGILTGFSEMEIINTPDDFEQRVMARVMSLPCPKMQGSMENMMCLIWGTVSVLFGFGFMLVLNREPIIEYFHAQPEFAAFAEVLTLAEVYSVAFAGNLSFVVNQLLSVVAVYVSASRYVLLAALAVLIAIQYIMYQRNKVDA